jgi:hypothetical protein
MVRTLTVSIAPDERVKLDVSVPLVFGKKMLGRRSLPVRGCYDGMGSRRST